jgi:hypothetical protein
MLNFSNDHFAELAALFFKFISSLLLKKELGIVQQVTNKPSKYMLQIYIVLYDRILIPNSIFVSSKTNQLMPAAGANFAKLVIDPL